MAIHNTQNHVDPEQVIEQSLNRFELFLERKGRMLLAVLGVVAVLVGAYFAYKYLYMGPRTQQAAQALYEAQHQFGQDSLALALNGDASFDGFLSVADKYGNTAPGNLAHHYAGICQLYLGDFRGAIGSFEAFDPIGSGSVGILLTAKNYGLTGDAYAELGELEKAASLYETAAAYSDNPDTTPTYLKKAGQASEALGDPARALKFYEQLKVRYGTSFPARDIDKFIAKVQQDLE